ncbi:anti-sigma factor family protein [Microbulbifer hainanensis]|uniref:anti-sigma factor family protein n=1 Tax=Microbulbifer hainanensis TaxID=2735675 RepID=UPI001867392E|nr:zf-HC2 domain-containing protein [Microbulbifer hainanensis]
MNCKYFDNFLDHYLDGLLDADISRAIEAHVADCDRCRKVRDKARALQAQLAGLDVEAPSPDLQQRVWQPLREQESTRAAGRRWTGLALAAGFVLALLLTALVPDTNSKVATVQLALMEEKHLQLMFTSDEAVDGAAFTIELPAHVQFPGYPERQQVSWSANLKQGKNLLRLPIVAASDVDDKMIARIRTADWEKVFELRLSTTKRS